MRTTSALEAFNSVLNRSLPKHANFFKFIDSIKQHEFSRYTEFSNSIDKCPETRKKKRKRDQLRDEKISECSMELKEKKIDVKIFLSKMSVRQDFPSTSLDESEVKTS